MKVKRNPLKFAVLLLILLWSVAPSTLYAATAQMQDYCQVPPFIGVTNPNLLLMIDNSASMFDLQYIDNGRKVCSNDATRYCVTNTDCASGGTCSGTCSNDSTKTCTSNSDCGSGNTCSAVKRSPTYCYDETYSRQACSDNAAQGCSSDSDCDSGATCIANTYYGYFNSTVPNSSTAQPQYYAYDFTNDYFTPISSASFPTTIAGCGSHTVKFRAGTFCVDIDTTVTPKRVLVFKASGNFLNWLTASKFDIEKQVLTGGKYGAIGSSATASGLIAETRGCVGRRFVKEPLSADFVNYDDGSSDPNITPTDYRMGITFGVRGPLNYSNPSAVSTGGQAYIDIFLGNYNAAACQDAIDDYTSGALKQTVVNDVAACLSYTTTNQKACLLDSSHSCNSDSDCMSNDGLCNITNDGVCGSYGSGDCTVTTAGICTAENGTCQGSGNSKTCVGGGKAGASCHNDHDCQVSICTNTGSTSGLVCSQNSDCAVRTCTNTGLTNGNSCSVDADCDIGSCSSGKPSTTACLTNTDCNTGAGSCTSGRVGNVCLTDTDCDTTNLGQCVLPVSTQIKSTFTQSINSCYQYQFNDFPIGSNEITQVTNPAGCNQIYDQYRVCNGGPLDGYQCACSSTGTCCATGKCVGGPSAIRAGSPVLLCSATYAGYCATSPDNWATNTSVTNWVAREYTAGGGNTAQQNCVIAKYKEYCNGLDVPPVTDPTTDPSATGNYDNLPAIINDLGVTAQLNNPIDSLTVQVGTSTVPTGLIQDFATTIRMGAMSFDFNGSPAECATRNTATGTVTGGPAHCSNNKTGPVCTADSDCTGGSTQGICNPDVPCPRICDSTSINAGQPCNLLPGGTSSDCLGGSCVLATNNVTNLDGATVLQNSYVKDLLDYARSWTAAGHSSTGIVHDIDNLTAGDWTPFSEGFYDAIGYYAQRSDMRLNSNDFLMDSTHPSPIPANHNCQKNYVLMITDGQPTADLNNDVYTKINNNASYLPSGVSYENLTSSNAVNTTGTACSPAVPYLGSRNIESLAYLAQNRDINDFTQQYTHDSQKITTYTVYSGTGSLDTDTCNNYQDSDLTTVNSCNPDNLMCLTARYGGGNYYLAQDPASLKTSLKDAFLNIAARASSGTAASVLASGEGSGANLIQALFYPRRQFALKTETYWAGTLQNLWYYIDPFFTNSNIREDTQTDSVLNLKSDYIIHFQPNPDPATPLQVDRIKDTNGDGSSLTDMGAENAEAIKSLWEAGKQLWSMSPDDRKIYTPCSINSAACLLDGTTNTKLMTFTPSHVDSTATLQKYLQASSSTEADRIVNYTRGYDKFCTGSGQGCAVDGDCSGGATCTVAPYRNRTVALADLNGDGQLQSNEENVWKLGDVLNSTPKIASWMPLNTYNKVYNDDTYGVQGADLFPDKGDDETHYITSRTSYPGYRNRGMVFAGANDGMLHAFRLGTLETVWSGQGDFEKAQLLRTCSKDSTTECTSDSACATGDTCPQLGQEMWAFIPTNTLPYLKYAADPDYCHVYSIDLTPFIFDASIEDPSNLLPTGGITPKCPNSTDYWNCTRDKSSWRTIVIGGMRYGGACRAKVCSVHTGTKCTADSDCPSGETCVTPGAGGVGTPLRNPSDSTKGLGYSAYFALDVTDSLADASKPPRLMWEFTSDQLGFSSTGPAVVRIKGLADPSDPSAGPDNGNNKDGRWFVVFGSGPTGPITGNQFRGSSDQDLRLFVVDLRTGALVNATAGGGCDAANPCPIDTGIAQAFAGSMLNSTFDYDLDYQDDMVDLGYVKGVTDSLGTTTWTKGGVGRLVTYGSLDPRNWKFTKVIDNIGPVTSAVVKLYNQHTGKLWLYFGSGRYYYYDQAAGGDDEDGYRTLYGVVDPCFTSGAFAADCSGSSYSVQRSDLNNASDVADAADTDVGWRIDLEHAVTASDPDNSLGAERVITDPLATSNGLVFFTTYAPYSSECKLGGVSYLWAVKYDTGGSPGAMLKGKALVQVSTGNIEQVDLSTAFSGANSQGGRRSGALNGVPPTAQGLSLLTQPPPVMRVLHMKER